MCFLLKVLNVFFVESTQYVFCFRYSICFLLKVLNVFSVEGTQCFLLKVLNAFCCRY